MPAVGRAYLQQVYFVKHPVNTLGVRTAREMRTVMLLVDYLTRNMVPAALDVLLQRQKALEPSVEQNSWQQANMLELVDMEEARSYFTQELKAAQSELRSEEKLGKGWSAFRDRAQDGDHTTKRSQRSPTPRARTRRTRTQPPPTKTARRGARKERKVAVEEY